MVWAMGSMSTAHIYRMMTDFGGWHLDFTGPLMILVQKITLVAFALHDGESAVVRVIPDHITTIISHKVRVKHFLIHTHTHTHTQARAVRTPH